MLNWAMLDLQGILSLVRADPAGIDPAALEAMACLCEPDAGGANTFRWVLRAWPLQPRKGLYIPHWLQVDNDYAAGYVTCGTAEECAMLRAILHTAAGLRRENRLDALEALADAAHNFPELIAGRKSCALRYVRKELKRVRRRHGVVLLPPPPPDREAVLEKILPYAGRYCTAVPSSR